MSISRDNSSLSQQQLLLQVYCKIKPSRAIDRLLTEHTLEKAYSIYNQLQENIKGNTAQLRSTLTHKYENLVNCSNLLITIKTFTQQIKGLQKDISSVFYKNHVQQLRQKKQKRIIHQIEENIYKKQYRKAMKLSFLKNQGINESQMFYLPFLRIQILQEMQTAILTKKFTDSFIEDMVQCLQIYIVGLSKDEREEMIAHDDKNQGNLLWLIKDWLIKFGGLRQSSNAKIVIEESDVMQIIFKCKLFSLNKKTDKAINEQQHIIKFFCDIYLILDNHQSSNHQISHLLTIFIKNLDHIQHNLYETFIINQHNSISFRYELYQNLLKSQPFINSLKQLSHLIVPLGNNLQNNTLYVNFLSLWQNYYKQLILILLNKINPLNNLNRRPSESLYPKQIQRYMCYNELEIEGQLKKYGELLVEFIKNLNELLRKSHQLTQKKFCIKNIIEEIVEIYQQGIVNINIQIKQYITKTLQKPSLIQLNYLIIIFLYSHSFNQSIASNINTSLINQNITIYKLQCKSQLLKPFYPCFYQNHQSKIWAINFDHFWMKYYHLDGFKLELIKQIILKLLQGMMQNLDEANAKQFLTAKKRQKVNIQYQKAKQSVLIDLPQHLKSQAFAKKKAAETS